MEKCSKCEKKIDLLQDDYISIDDQLICDDCSQGYYWSEALNEYIHEDEVFMCSECGDILRNHNKYNCESFCECCGTVAEIYLEDTNETICTLIDDNWYYDSDSELYYRNDPELPPVLE